MTLKGAFSATLLFARQRARAFRDLSDRASDPAGTTIAYFYCDWLGGYGTR